MKCKYCGKEMRQDNYFICDDCKASAIEKIRYGKSTSVNWGKGDEE